MNPLVFTYGALIAAIVSEVIGTTFLQKSQQFTKLGPSLLTAISYGAAFYALSHTLTVLPVGIAYAIWSSLGIVLISTVGFFVFKQSLDVPAMLGIGCIVVGVVIINVFSKSVAH
ncbi:SMR family transporter [Burkholderia sp. BCC1999]|uniref:SMR family transporter n=1 Tax=Burkholderia sp. BCC1999 TaxID=2817448 RepID=UPI002AC33761|nr:SMR family transporter [Burkholderia sp. BCC1999]